MFTKWKFLSSSSTYSYSGMIIRLLRNLRPHEDVTKMKLYFPYQSSEVRVSFKPNLEHIHWSSHLELQVLAKHCLLEALGYLKETKSLSRIIQLFHSRFSFARQQMFHLCRGLDFENFVDIYLVSSLHSRLAKYLVYKIYLRKFWSVLKLLEEGLKPTTRFVSWFQRTHGMYSSPEIERTCCGEVVIPEWNIRWVISKKGLVSGLKIQHFELFYSGKIDSDLSRWDYGFWKGLADMTKCLSSCLLN